MGPDAGGSAEPWQSQRLVAWAAGRRGGGGPGARRRRGAGRGGAVPSLRRQGLAQCFRKCPHKGLSCAVARFFGWRLFFLMWGGMPDPLFSPSGPGSRHHPCTPGRGCLALQGHRHPRPCPEPPPVAPSPGVSRGNPPRCCPPRQECSADVWRLPRSWRPRWESGGETRGWVGEHLARGAGARGLGFPSSAASVSVIAYAPGGVFSDSRPRS